MTFSANNVQSSLIAMCVFIIAQATDHADGFIARHFSMPTAYGYVQDSLGDKVFQFSLALAACREFELSPLIPWSIFFREICILSIRVVKNFSHKELHDLRLWSILYAILVRGSIAVLIALPAAEYYLGLPSLIALRCCMAAFFISILPATIGIYLSIKLSGSTREL